MANPAWKKGHKGGPGRPVGCKNKNFVSLNLWLELIHETLGGMTPQEKIQHGFHAAEMILSKIPALPGSPGDSKNNADQALAELKAAEEYGIDRNAGSAQSQPGSNGADVATGSAQGEVTA